MIKWSFAQLFGWTPKQVDELDDQDKDKFIAYMRGLSMKTK